MAGAAIWGIAARNAAHAALEARSERHAQTSVVAVRPAHGPQQEDLILPGTMQAYLDAPIYARTNGYVKAWHTDIGTQVTKGQLLAEIDTPEVDEQLRQAQADLNTAEANGRLAARTAKRWEALATTDSVSKQENDEKSADAAAKGATVAAARANVARLEQLEGFKRVVAPFDGVVTARKTDVGALINAGSGVGPELFHVADTSRLRIYVQVPEAYTPMIVVGIMASLHVVELPRPTLTAMVARTAEAIDAKTRTLLIELQADNTHHELLPGSYAEVHFAISPAETSVRLPVNTLLFRAEGLRVARLDAANHVSLVPVVLGRDFGTEVEVADGVTPDDLIVLNPPDSLEDGEAVQLVAPPPARIAAATAAAPGGAKQ
jgi:RND family efflux transporter MFP subunit